MRARMKAALPETALGRVLRALEQELIEAPDEEIVEAAASLGMHPQMKGSAAFAGIRYPTTPQLSDFFELDACAELHTPLASRKLKGPTRD